MSPGRPALGLVGAVLMLGVSVATVGVASAAPSRQTTCPATTGTSCVSTHGGGSSHVPGTTGHGATKYCVSGYQPGTSVTITNPIRGVSKAVTVGLNGTACTTVTLGDGCPAITAAGTGAGGTATSSSARVCEVTAADGSSLPFTGSDLIIPGTAIGAALLVVGLGLLAIGRRRVGTPA
jgi:hypothetical protein